MKKIRIFLELIIAITAVIGIIISFSSFKNTINISQKQLEQSEKFYELQNKPFISIEKAGWYSLDKTLAGDTGLRFPVIFVNVGKLPALNVKAIQHMVLIIKTDTLKRYQKYNDDMATVSEELDVDKDRRIYREYTPYRQKPFKEISNFIFGRKKLTTKEDIINNFSTQWKEEGYEIQAFGDLEIKNFDTILPNRGDQDDRGRSLNPEVEKQILESGGDILIFYYAVSYNSPFGERVYLSHYLGCYDSFTARKNKDKMHHFTYNKLFFSELESTRETKPEKQGEIKMLNLWILPENNKLNYVFLVIGIALIIRIILSLFKVCAIRQGEAGDVFKNVGRLRAFIVSFFSWGHSRDIDDYWLPFIIGLSELFIYPTLMLNDKWLFIGTWIGIKTASTWGSWQQSRTPYNRFLLGNILVLIISYVMARCLF